MMQHNETGRLAVPVTNRDHIRGPEHAPVTLVEYGDFECDNCGAAYPIVKELQKRMGNDLRFVFRNFPLTEVHPCAEGAAEASEAAAAQGQFWKMHDILFENQQYLALEDLQEYAQRIGLDVKRFTRELTGRVYQPMVEMEIEGGEQSGVEGTPWFFINGVFYDDSYDLDSLLRACREAAQEQKERAPVKRSRGQAKRTMRRR